MKLLITFLALMAISSSLAYSDDLFSDDSAEVFFEKRENIVNIYDNLVGVRYSNISGYGLSFARRFSESYEFLICGLAHYRQSKRWEDMSKRVITDENKDVLMDFGVELKRDFIKTSTTCIYGLIGTYYSDDTQKNSSPYYGDETSNKNFSIGVGIGMRVFLDKRFSFNLNFGYKFDHTDKVSNNSPGLDEGTNVGLGAGIDFGF
jgi:hypothetical protein